MKILLTGARGFIGSRLYKKLIEFHDVVSYDLKCGADIRDRIKLDKLFEAEQFDMVIHLAALAGVRRSEDFPDEYISTNITGTKNLIDASKKYGVKKFIFYSSSSVLGGGIGLKETDEYNPKGLYAVSKVTGELLVKSSGLDYMIVRPFTVYGENGRPDMVIYKWINEIKAGKPIIFFGDGNTSRGYTYIDDLLEGTLKLITNINLNYTVHLGGSEEIKLSEVLDIFKKVAKEKNIEFSINTLPIPDGDVTSSLADTTRANTLIDFNPTSKFKDIIENIINKEL